MSLAALHGEGDRRPLDRDDLADQAGQVGDGATELSRPHLEHRRLLLVGRAIIDEDRRLPGLRDEHVLGDVDRRGKRQPADVRALDRAGVDVPGESRLADSAVGVLTHPARAQHVAGADLQQPSFDVVCHRDPSWRRFGRLCSICRLGSCQSVDRPTSVG
jgi:hypothetical protein